MQCNVMHLILLKSLPKFKNPTFKNNPIVQNFLIKLDENVNSRDSRVAQRHRLK